MLLKGETLGSLAKMTESVILGFDPGGDSTFGVAMLSGPHVISNTVSSVREAIDWTIAQCGNREVTAAGIDTLLHWSTVRGGWRPADKYLRATYPNAKGSVLSPNGLYGSMAIGGMALAMELRHRWPGIVLNETHPKVLFSALSGDRYRRAALALAIEWFLDHTKLHSTHALNEHEFDAMISAWATQFGLSDGWPDLVGSDSHLLFPVGSVKYLWPSRLGAH